MHFEGYEGDSLAAALLANGVRVLGRSFKYHRRRGVMGLGGEEPNVLVTLRSGDRHEPNLKATEVELYEGLEERGVRFVELFDAFKNSDTLLYYRTDSHWNQNGIDIAYKETTDYISSDSILSTFLHMK